MSMTGYSDPPSGVKWSVTGQHQRVAPGRTGRMVPGVTVAFQLQNGDTGSVFIPEAAYNADNVRTIIAMKAKAMADVADLSGS